MSERISKPKVFISYSHKDQDIVEKVAVLLKERDIDVWYDEWKLTVGSSLIHEIQEGIRKADFVIIFFSKNAEASKWLKEEYEASKVRQIESDGETIILPVRLDDCEIPLLLQSRLYADFRYSFTSGFTKLVGSILGSDTSLIDQAFAKYSQKAENIIKEKATIPRFSYDEIQNDLNRKRDDKWLSVGYGVLSINSYSNDKTYSSGGYPVKQFEKYLGNTSRDYLIFKLYDESYNLLMTNKKEKEPADFCVILIEHLYNRLNEGMRSFGLPTFRYADFDISAELNHIFYTLFKE